MNKMSSQSQQLRKQTKNQQSKNDLSKSKVDPEKARGAEASKNLRLTEDSIGYMKKRLSVLQIRDKKMQSKAISNEKKYLFHQQIQDQIMRRKQNKELLLKSLNKELERSKQRILSSRRQRYESLRQIREDLSNIKRQQYEKSQVQKRINESAIQQLKLQDLLNKITKKKVIQEFQNKQKQHVKEYFENKKKNFIQDSRKKGQQIQNKIESRQKILQELHIREATLIYKQSTSQAALQKSYQKLYNPKPVKIKAKNIINDETNATELSQKSPHTHKSEEILIF